MTALEMTPLRVTRRGMTLLDQIPMNLPVDLYYLFTL